MFIWAWIFAVPFVAAVIDLAVTARYNWRMPENGQNDNPDLTDYIGVYLGLFGAVRLENLAQH